MELAEAAAEGGYGWQVRVSRTSIAREGKWRKISSRMFSPRELIVVGLDSIGDFADGGSIGSLRWDIVVNWKPALGSESYEL